MLFTTEAQRFLTKKCPAIGRATKGGTGLGMPVPMARKKGESGPTPGYSVFTKKHFKLSSKNFYKTGCCFFIND